jgi:hypothetical protein
MSQTSQEAFRVFQEWYSAFAPQGLLPSEENVKALADYIRLHFGGVVSVTGLNEAVAAIPNLEYQAQKSPAELAAEFEAKEAQRILREAAENRVDWKEKTKKTIDAQKAKQEAEDKQAVAKTAINTAISSYSANRTSGPGIDYALTQKRQNYLLTLVAQQPVNVDQIKLLAIIKQKIMEWPG